MEFFKQKGPLSRHFLWTVVYVMLVYTGGARELRPILEPLGLWFDVWIWTFGMAVLITADIVYDLLLLNGFTGVWRWIHGPADEAELEQRRRRILFENEDYPVSKGAANAAMLVMLAAIVVSFVWFAFLA